MPRPHKLGVPYETLNVILPVELKDKLRSGARLRSRLAKCEVSMSELVREALNFRFANLRG